MRAAFVLFGCALGLLACGGAAGHGAAADGPLPSGSHDQRGLVLEQDEPPAEQAAPAGDGTSTPEIVKSVEKDRP